jgi:O-antigen ligase
VRAESLQTKAPLMKKNLVAPLAVSILGALIAIRFGVEGTIIFFAGYIWLASVSLPAAAILYILAAPFPIGIILRHHKFYAADFMAVVMALKLLKDNISSGLAHLADTFFPQPFRWPLVFLLVLSVLSLADSLSHFGTVIKILEYIEFFVVMVAVFRTQGTDERVWNWYLGALFAVVAVMVAYGLFQFMFELGPVYNIVDGHHVRATGFFGQPNVFGAFSDQTFPMLAALVVLGPDTLKKGWLKVAMAIAALGVVISYSRGSWVADAGAIFFMGILIWSTRGWPVVKRFAAYAIGIPIAAFALVFALGKTNLSNAALYIGPHKNTLERLRTTVTAVLNPAGHFDTDQRLLIWKSAVTAIRQHPWLGVGLGNFHLFIQHHPPKGLAAVPPMAHNLYLEWGADLGVGGIIAGLWLEWSWIVGTLKLVRGKLTELPDYWYAALVGAFGTILAFTIHNWVDFLIDQGVILPLLLALALVSAGWERYRKPQN